MPLETNGSYGFGPFTLKVHDKSLIAGGEAVDLGPMGVDVLIFLIANRGSVVSRAELARDVWKAERVSDDAIYRQISDIRKSLDQFDDSRKYIETKHSRGWRFIGTVEMRTDLSVQALTPTAHPVAEQPQPAQRGWWKIVIAVACGLAIAAGAVLIAKGMRDSEPRITGVRPLTHDGLPKEGRLYTDGRVIYFTEHVSHEADSDSRLATVPVSGGEVTYQPAPVRPGTRLDIGRQDGWLYWNGTRVGGEPLIWVQNEGSPGPVGTHSSVASISPDGGLLAYADGPQRSLCVRDLGSAQKVRYISLSGDAAWPRWSGDGTRIRFSVVDPTSYVASLWEVRRDGSNLRQLSIPAERDKQLLPVGWTADGRYFIFSELRLTDHRSNLWIVPDDSRDVKSLKPVRLTTGLLDFRAAVAAPDDLAIFAIRTEFRNQLVRFDLQRRVFVSFWEGVLAIDVAFSNNGAWAAFSGYPEFTLWVSQADGSERRQITSPGIEVHQPHWSPDGRRIAYMGRMGEKPWKIYIVNPAGGVPQEAKQDDPFDQGVPSWSADGGSLVFGELRGRKPDAEMVIRVLDLGTGRETILPGSKGKWSPRWSPDGNTILAQTTDFKELDLFDCKSQSWRVLTRALSDDATWSQDGRFVHFMAYTERGRALFRVRVEDGRVEELALQPEFEYSWSGVAPDGSPLTLRAAKIEEIYALDLKLP